MPEVSSSWSGVWSPNGLTLAFFTNNDGVARLWLWSPINTTLKQATTLGARPFFGFESPIWTLDGKSIIFKAMPDGDIDTSGILMKSFINQDLIDEDNIQVFSIEKSLNNQQNKNWVERYRAELSRFDLETGKITSIVKDLYPVGMKLSNNGTKIAFTSALGQENDNIIQVNYDLWVASIFPLEQQAPKCIANKVRMEYGLSFSWANNDKAILYTTGGPLSDGNLWTFNVSDDFIPRQLGLENHVYLGREYDAPFPLDNGDALMVANERLGKIKKKMMR